MSNQWPPYGGGYHEDAYAHTYERRGVNRWGILAIGLFAVLSFYSTIVVASRLDHIYRPGNEFNLPIIRDLPGPHDTPEDKDAAETIEERINILFLGLDRRIDEPEDQPYRTDSVMVLTIDPFSKTAGALSIPRDTIVDINDADGDFYTSARINEVYEFGQFPRELNVPGLAGYPGGGAGLVMDTIENNFGIQLDHYMVMDWVDFMGIIDELGGVDINVPEYAYDPLYANCSYCNDVYSVEFIPGPEHMDGERALAYARIRKSDNDFKRIERQQLVLKAMAAKAASIGTILNNPIGLYNKFNNAVVTDVSAGRAAGLGLLYRDVQNKANETGTESIRTVSLAPATYDCFCEFAGLLFDPVEAQELIANVFSDSRVINESASVEILNATPTPELAATFARYMQSKGIAADKISIDEYADGLIYDTTFVIDRTGASEHTLNQISDWLTLPDGRIVAGADPQSTPLPPGLPDAVLESLSDIVIVLGSDVEVDWTTGQLNVSSGVTGGG